MKDVIIYKNSNDILSVFDNTGRKMEFKAIDCNTNLIDIDTEKLFNILNNKGWRKLYSHKGLDYYRHPKMEEISLDVAIPNGLSGIIHASQILGALENFSKAEGVDLAVVISKISHQPTLF